MKERNCWQRKGYASNCTGPSRTAPECRSTSTCKHCNNQHHTSICDMPKEIKPEAAMTASKEEDKYIVYMVYILYIWYIYGIYGIYSKYMVYPIVLVEINGIKTHALLDTTARSSYASTKLVNALNKKPKEVKTKRIEMMLTSSTTRIEIYSANIKSMDGKFNMNIELSKVDKAELMSVKNPQYKLLEKYNHLKGAKLENRDTRPGIPIHVVLGTSDYAMVKNTTAQKVGLPGQLIAERTLLECTVMSPGSEEVYS